MLTQWVSSQGLSSQPINTLPLLGVEQVHIVQVFRVAIRFVLLVHVNIQMVLHCGLCGRGVASAPPRLLPVRGRLVC